MIEDLICIEKTPIIIVDYLSPRIPPYFPYNYSGLVFGSHARTFSRAADCVAGAAAAATSHTPARTFSRVGSLLLVAAGFGVGPVAAASAAAACWWLWCRPEAAAALWCRPVSAAAAAAAAAAAMALVSVGGDC